MPRSCAVAGVWLLIAVASWGFAAGAAAGDPPDVSGRWLGTWVGDQPTSYWASDEFPTGARLEMSLEQSGPGAYAAELYLAEYGLLDTPIPAMLDGDALSIGDPPL
ncbi:MAG: hypothetical protein JRG83_13515 [Deltaproteobacteria bacterium]|nr:hypothetical protein [Deltaproteobacteria bacterium]